MSGKILKNIRKQLRYLYRGKSNQELLQATDVFLVSYPRSGNTWCRTILTHLLYPDFELKKLSDINRYVPGIHRPFPRHNNYSEPRVIKTHQAFHFRFGKKDKQLYRKNIYIVRNVLDVAKSFYQYKQTRRRISGVSLDEFAQKMAYGMYAPGSWQEHILGWYGASQFYGEVLFVRYEDMEQDIVKEIARMANFLGFPKSVEEYEAIALKSDIHQMRVAQERGPLGKNSEMIRKGDKRLPELSFSKDTIDLFMKFNREAMSLFDYI